MPFEERVFSASGQMLKRMVTESTTTDVIVGTYTAQRDPRDTKQIEILFEPGESSALARMTEIVYDTNADPAYFASLNPKQVKTYNYIVLDLSTAQTANIVTIAGMFSASDLATIAETDYLYDANYKARNVNGLAAETRVKDANGIVKSRSQISYDEGENMLSSSGSMPTAAANSWIDPVTELGPILSSKRGLPTTVKSYYDIVNGHYIETHSFYDQYGNVRKVRDGRGNDTTMEYDDDYAFGVV